MKQLIITLLITLLSLVACKKEDDGLKIIKELHGGLYEDGTWAPMAYRKVSIMKSESNYPLPPALYEIASTYTDELGKYSFDYVDFQSHESYYIYFHFDNKKYFDQSSFANPIYVYNDEERVHLLTGRAKVHVKARSKDGKKNSFTISSSRNSGKSFIDVHGATVIMDCKALMTDTVVFSYGTPPELLYIKPTFYTYINDTAYIEINF